MTSNPRSPFVSQFGGINSPRGGFEAVTPAIQPILLLPLIDGSDIADQTSYSTQAFTPLASSLLIAVVQQRSSGMPPTVPTLTNHGTWVALFDHASNTEGVSIFACDVGASPSSDTLDLDFSGQTQFNIAWQVYTVIGSDAVAAALADQTDGDVEISGTTLATDLGAGVAAENLHLAAVFADAGTPSEAAFEVLTETLFNARQLTTMVATGEQTADVGIPFSNNAVLASVELVKTP